MVEKKNWKGLFSNLKLSDGEKIIVARFIRTPRSRSFLSVAEILKKHGRISGCIELLSVGLQWYPSYSAARVVLAKEYFEQGLIEQAEEILSAARESLIKNFTAQKLKLKIAIVLNNENLAWKILREMGAHDLLNDQVKDLAHRFRSTRFAQVRTELISELEQAGIKLPQVLISPASPPPPPTLPPQLSRRPNGAWAKPGEDLASHLDRAKGFYVAPVNQIFAGCEIEGLEDEVKGDLDSATLAELYESQGHYIKALAIYRKLAYFAPNNDFLRRKIADMGELAKHQRIKDYAVDPEIVQQMQKIDAIDVKIDFLYSILDRLD